MSNEMPGTEGVGPSEGTQPPEPITPKDAEIEAYLTECLKGTSNEDAVAALKGQLDAAKANFDLGEVTRLAAEVKALEGDERKNAFIQHGRAWAAAKGLDEATLSEHFDVPQDVAARAFAGTRRWSEDEVVGVCEGLGEFTARQLANALNVTEPTAQSRVKTLIANGRIESVGTKNTGGSTPARVFRVPLS